MTDTIFVAELVGTMFLMLLGNGVVANIKLDQTKGEDLGWFATTTAWAFAVFVGVVIAAPYSGAHLNPAVTIGLAIVEKTAWSDVLSYISGQFIGAMLGAFLVWIMYKKHFNITQSEEKKLACFSTAPAIRNTVSNFISEMVGTFVLVFVIFYLTNPSFESNTLGTAKIGLGSIGALPVAILVWVIGLSLGGTTGYAINPARDLAPRILHSLLPFKGKSDWSYAWIPVVAPLVGAIIAGGLYLILQHYSNLS